MIVLLVNDKDRTDAPSENDLFVALNKIQATGGFIVLLANRMTYIQAALSDREGLFDVEYQAGSLSDHWYSSTSIERRVLLQILSAYLNGSDRWRHLLSWQKVAPKMAFPERARHVKRRELAPEREETLAGWVCIGCGIGFVGSLMAAKHFSQYSVLLCNLAGIFVALFWAVGTASAARQGIFVGGLNSCPISCSKDPARFRRNVISGYATSVVILILLVLYDIGIIFPESHGH